MDLVFPAHRVEVGDGAVVSVRVAGPRSAPAVVLMHGIGSGAASWWPVAQRLAAQARIIAWDAPGYGDSTPLPDPRPDATAYADRWCLTLDALRIAQAVVVGHSLGALMAGACAQHHPDRVRRLVLLAPAGGYGSPALRERAEEVRQERLHALQALGVEGLARQRGPQLVRATTDEVTRAWAVWNMARLRPEGYRQAVELLCEGDLTACAPASMPVEVHVGDEDTVTPPQRVAALADAFGASCHPIAQAGHLCTLDQPDAVAHIVRAALVACTPDRTPSTGRHDVAEVRP